MKSLDGYPRASGNLGLGLLVSMLTTAAATAAVSITNVTPANVTPDGFSVLWETSGPSRPSISVYSDASGAGDLQGQVGVEALPLHSGNPGLIEPYLRRQNHRTLRQKTVNLGLGHIRISDCAPGTTYYYRVHAVGLDGVEVTWPQSGPLPSVTTALDTAFVPQARQLLVDVAGGDVEGQILKLTSTNAAHALTAVVGDGAGTNQAFFNLADLLALSGETSYVPLGTQTFDIEILGVDGPGTVSQYQLTFTADFVVADSERLSLAQEFLIVELPVAIINTGEPASISLGFQASVPVTNMTFQMSLPEDRLSGLSLESDLPQMGSATVQALSATEFRFTFSAAPGSVFQGNTELARMVFDPPAGQQSAFVPLHPMALLALDADGNPVSNAFVELGRLVIIDAEPLLETGVGSGGERVLTLYGHPGASYQVQSATDLAGAGNWQNWMRLPLTNQFQSLRVPVPSPLRPLTFYRAYEFVAESPLIDLFAGSVGTLNIYGQPGGTYELQSATNLTGIVAWKQELSFTLTNSFRIVNNVPLTNQFLVFRVAPGTDGP